MCVRLLTATLLIILVTLSSLPAQARGCVGDLDCRVCRNCTQCRYCNMGGRCGVSMRISPGKADAGYSTRRQSFKTAPKRQNRNIMPAPTDVPMEMAIQAPLISPTSTPQPLPSPSATSILPTPTVKLPEAAPGNSGLSSPPNSSTESEGSGFGLLVLLVIFGAAGFAAWRWKVSREEQKKKSN